MTFPTVIGTNLLREKLTLPQDFQGKLNLLFIVFEQWQQTEVNSWMDLARELEVQINDLVYYELPTIETRNSLYKLYINEGMRVGIPNLKSRERTITLYLDKAKFLSSLDVKGEEHIFVLLVDQQGKEFFRTRGPYIPEKEAALRKTLEQIIKQEI